MANNTSGRVLMYSKWFKNEKAKNLIDSQRTLYKGLVRCSFMNFIMVKHLIFSYPKTGAMVSSGVKYCLFSGSWRFFCFK